MDVERRFVPVGEVRAAPEARSIEGMAAVIGSESVDLGGFTEIIERGAFAEALERSDVVALFNHDPNIVLGRSSSGTLQLRETDEGLHYTVEDMPESRADVLEMIRRGDVKGNSFSFTVDEDRWETRDGQQLRIISRFKELFDVGPVTYPAYRDTSVSARALQIAEERSVEKPETEDAEALAAIKRKHAARKRRLKLAEVE